MEYLKGLSIIGVQQIDRVVEVVDEAVKGHSVRLLGQKKDGGRRLGGARLDLPKIRKNPLIEIISINTGCLNACTYCKTKHARGDLASYPIEELVERARQSFQDRGFSMCALTEERFRLQFFIICPLYGPINSKQTSATHKHQSSNTCHRHRSIKKR
ncbi:threonylcarbamoyladenosine tRNA methylthiotransferase-like [Stegastes partitus]|uniref:Threonylcarbamoyladenosine tRNA methylthiotransferase-like n=1 Tax=Stegastes partitus TaxID=144197 RepID=A0A9Y4U1A2_9TELE|nr:PREDICTED: threonylcarbamoyladenosine tRNA methylthiotransferase-like [Stegastes partitus]